MARRLNLNIKILDLNPKLVFLLGMSDPPTICQRIDSPSVSTLNKKLILSSLSPFLSIHHPLPLETLPSRHVTTKSTEKSTASKSTVGFVAL
jgi:hypothetical protein